MQRFQKTLTVLILSLLLSQPVPVHAQHAAFADVPADHPYSQSILQAVDIGLVKGGCDGGFAPDRPLSLLAEAILLCRAFGTEGDLVNPILACQQYGWTAEYNSTYPHFQVCKKDFYRAAFHAAGDYIYDSDLFGEDVAGDSMDKYLRTAFLLGLSERDSAPDMLISRGEAVNAILILQDGNYHIPTPPILTELSIEMETPGWDAGLKELLLVPESIRGQFSESGWHLVFGSKEVDRYSLEHDMTAIGLTSYSKRTIYAKTHDAVPHEFGHFLERAINATQTAEHLYEEEGSAARKILGSYSTTNSKEFFAEFFAYFIRHSDDPDKLSLLQTTAPKTFAFFEHLERANWFT
ncbi:MAG: hypothetical protein NC548_53870 [Lachnospiraceae bacterium]|nr:hypothetical protein [Lachnospiraceae bacterium]